MQTAERTRTCEIVDHQRWWSREQRSIIAAELRRIRVPGRAVHIGAADGACTQVLEAHGWHTMAVDPSPTAVELLRARGFDACRCDTGRLLLPSQRFDFALALDALDRSDDIPAAAGELVRVLRPGGRALISVPGVLAPSCCAGSPGTRASATLPDVTGALAEAGLVIDRVWHRGVLLGRMPRRYRHLLAHPDAERFSPLTDHLLGVVSAVERMLPTGRPSGMSVFVRAHRP